MKKLMQVRLLMLALLLVTLSGWSEAQNPTAAARPEAPKKRLLVVFAHPDDETIVAPLLGSYARRGVDVHLMVATDGQKGVMPHAGIPAGEALAKVRAEEARCSAHSLGIAPPILVGLEDAGLAAIRPYPGEPLERLATALRAKLAEWKPDAVITWGPEGAYGHPDHRLTGDVVRQLFQAGEENTNIPLYFVGFPRERTEGAPRWYGFKMYPVADELLVAQVAFAAADLQAARRALSCHKSQATPEMMDESFSALTHLWNGRIQFQQWNGTKKKSDLFE
jgi:LmbE family N-acetylglucosaminyl deacetylase